MSVIYYDPIHDFDRLFNEAFDTRFPTWTVRSTHKDVFKPRVDIHEDHERNQVVASFELPGLTKEQVNIELRNNRLTVSGEFKRDSSHQETGWVVTERSSGAFSRMIQVPSGLKPEDIKASMEHGILTVTFPKLTEDQQPKKITVG